MKELWSQVRDLPDYEISTRGRVRRARKRGGKPVLDDRNKQVYLYFKERPYIGICGKTYSVRRLMAETFLNDGETLSRKKVTKGSHQDLATVTITETPPATPKNNHAAMVAEWCKENFIDDELCQRRLAILGVNLSLRTVKTYRLRAGYKQR